MRSGVSDVGMYVVPATGSMDVDSTGETTLGVSAKVPQDTVGSLLVATVVRSSSYELVDESTGSFNVTGGGEEEEGRGRGKEGWGEGGWL